MFKEYANNNRKLANAITRKEFLIRCRSSGLVPNHIINTFKCTFSLLEAQSPYTGKLQGILDRFQRSVLNVEIQNTFNKISKLTSQQSVLKQHIMSATPGGTHAQFLFLQEIAYHSTLNNSRRRTDKKYKALLDRTTTTHTGPSLNQKAILNATDVSLPKDMEVLLSLGPKFAVEPRRTPISQYFHLIADVESIINSNPDRSTQENTRAGVVNIIQNHINRSGSGDTLSSTRKFCTKAMKTAEAFLKQHPEICILQSDKGNRTVVMRCEDYVAKMNHLLADTSTYATMTSDPTSKLQKQNNNFVTRLADLDLIDAKTAKRLRTNTAVCPRIYGQPKAHKADLPLRPVVPTMTAPNYQLTKYIANILQTSISVHYSVNSSFEFSQFMNECTIPPGYIMVSFDVVSLFTNIPYELVRKGIIHQWDNIKTKTTINLDLFLEIVQHCVESSYFKFGNQHYKQIAGMAMGSPLSPVLAEIVTDALIETVVTTLHIMIPIIKKYVDDLFLCIPQEQIHDVLQAFNSYHPKLQFTAEVEENQQLPFLDVLVIRHENQTFSTDWYKKPIASGRFLNFHSMHAIHLKTNVAHNLIERVNKLSTIKTQEEKNQTIREELQANDYPITLINRMINNRNMTRTRTEQTNNDETIYRSIPYIDKLSPLITKHIQQTGQYANIKICHYNNNTMQGMYTRMKGTTEKQQRSNVIYSLRCQQCEAMYVGLTTNKLQTRLYGHKSDKNKLDKIMDMQDEDYKKIQLDQWKERTAIMHHSATTGHTFDYSNPTILDTSNKPTRLPILEICHILTTKNINKRTDTDGLSISYTGIMHTLKKYHHHNNTNSNRPNTSLTQTQNQNQEPS